MINVRNIKITPLFAVAAGVFVALAVTGAVRWYSPVPFWDSWRGYLYFYVHADNWHTWWAAHNEHRIVLSRALFWMDLAWFHGTGLFLIVVDYLFQALAAWIFWIIWRESTGNRLRYLGYFLIAWLFFWSQRTNFVWGFQGAFILAQLLPLAAFWLLHLAASRERQNTLLFAAAVLLGILSTGTMANGLLALPLMTLFSLLTRMRWRRSLLLAGLSVAAIWLYFHNYHAPPRNSSLTSALTEDPLGLAHYMLLFVGSPFYYIFGQVPAARIVAAIAGGFLLASSAAFAWRILWHQRQNTLSLTLLIFLLYVGGSAVGAAGARVGMGVDQSLSSRYTTPVLMAWATLFVLYAPVLETFDQRSRGRSWIPFALLLIAMLPQQILALGSQHERMFHRKVGALAIELAARDRQEILNICWSVKDAFALADAARQRGLSIFGLPPFKGAREAIGSTYRGASPISLCRGHLDQVRPIEGETRFIRVYGWFYARQNHSIPPSLQFVDGHDIVRGIALTGERRKDVAKAVGFSARYSGFIGYLTKDTEGKPIIMVDPQTGCRIDGQVPITLFSYAPARLQPGRVSVPAGRVGTGNDWIGGDAQHSKTAGLTILGSFIHSGSDTGSLRLAMKRGDTLLYRSGPNVSRQTISVVGKPGLSATLPPAPQWVQLDFSSNRLPETFTLKFSDNGNRKGEWSAVALRKTR